MTDHKTLSALGFHDMEQYYLNRALKDLQAKQPPKEAPKEVQASYDAPKGVTYDKQNGSWRAFGPYKNGKQKYIGSYREKHHAIMAREEYMEKERGIS